jgi:hypothetical protein
MARTGRFGSQEDASDGPDREARRRIAVEARRLNQHWERRGIRPRVERVRSKYPEWWLVLVDRIAHGLSSDHAEELRKRVPRDESWDKIVIVSPMDASKYFELI